VVPLPAGKRGHVAASCAQGRGAAGRVVAFGRQSIASGIRHFGRAADIPSPQGDRIRRETGRRATAPSASSVADLLDFR